MPTKLISPSAIERAVGQPRPTNCFQSFSASPRPFSFQLMQVQWKLFCSNQPACHFHLILYSTPPSISMKAIRWTLLQCIHSWMGRLRLASVEELQSELDLDVDANGLQFFVEGVYPRICSDQDEVDELIENSDPSPSPSGLPCPINPFLLSNHSNISIYVDEKMKRSEVAGILERSETAFVWIPLFRDFKVSSNDRNLPKILKCPRFVQTGCFQTAKTNVDPFRHLSFSKSHALLQSAVEIKRNCPKCLKMRSVYCYSCMIPFTDIPCVRLPLKVIM